ncbi:MAG TPA: hypothetical protein VNJ01_06540 [Bacteriovoracaceae bacterium]|nr:hypothetical protein [Bacteriovoracaceae bacterium]
MKKSEPVLKIFNLSQPVVATEWSSLMGDKYQGTMSFNWEFVTDFSEAQIILWDGVMTPKGAPFFRKVLAQMAQSKILLLYGEAMTSLKNHWPVELIDPEQFNWVDLTGWSVLPEDILSALEQCHRKLTHV